jgi:transposase
MLGRQRYDERLFYQFRLEDHVPANHLLRRIDALLDLSFVHPLLSQHYSAIGRPSVDPELMLRMLLVGYLFGIRSERRLVEEIHLNLAYRWFCRLGLEGQVPDASTFSKNRHGRFRDSGLFRELFEAIVTACIRAGLVGGEAMSVDGSFLAADATFGKRLPGDRLPEGWREPNADLGRPVREYLAALDAATPPAPDEPEAIPPKHLSPTDPQAAWSVKTGVGRFGYAANYLIDNAHAIILDVEATPARASQEVVAAKTMLERTDEMLELCPDRLAADTGYGTGRFLTWLLRRGIEPHIPVLERKSQTKGKFTRDAFTYDAATDSFTCPKGKKLTYRGADRAARVHSYRSRAGDCAACPIRSSCTDGKVRAVSRLFDEDARDQARALADTEAFARSQRERLKVEMLFAHLKHHLGLRRLRLRGLKGATEQCLMAATVQNLRRLVRLTTPGDGPAVALAA